MHKYDLRYFDISLLIAKYRYIIYCKNQINKKKYANTSISEYYNFIIHIRYLILTEIIYECKATKLISQFPENYVLQTFKFLSNPIMSIFFL